MAKFCTNCGAPLEDGKCSSCGNGGTKKASEVKTEEKVVENKSTTNTSSNPAAKNKVAAIVLSCPFLIGCFGAHNFYLGNTGKAVAQLLISIIGMWFCGIGLMVTWVWSLVEFIQLLTGNISTDANGVPLE